ncbi:MAG: flagellar basal body rod protein FlgC [Gemmatimonadota bacterium]|nr:flagellar basal body rod protein FlgC [Gemmatimonadota bacterium]
MEIFGGFDPADASRRFFRPLRVAASGLTAQRVRMETIAENIANAEATRTAGGGAYQRQVARLEARPRPDTGPLTLASLDVPPLPFQEGEPGGVDVTAVEADPTEGPLVYDPGHPDADANGYVRYPNVELSQETVDLMLSRRAYEANATVFQVLKSVLHRALSI